MFVERYVLLYGVQHFLNFFHATLQSGYFVAIEVSKMIINFRNITKTAMLHARMTCMGFKFVFLTLFFVLPSIFHLYFCLAYNSRYSVFSSSLTSYLSYSEHNFSYYNCFAPDLNLVMFPLCTQH